jgi:hypothetical protein
VIGAAVMVGEIATGEIDEITTTDDGRTCRRGAGRIGGAISPKVRPVNFYA